jgi:hypothetical protein
MFQRTVKVPVPTKSSVMQRANSWLMREVDIVLRPPLSEDDVTDTEPAVLVAVLLGLAIGFDGLYETPLIWAATSKTDPPPNS